MGLYRTTRMHLLSPFDHSHFVSSHSGLTGFVIEYFWSESSDLNKYIVDEWYCVPDASKNETGAW